MSSLESLTFEAIFEKHAAQARQLGWKLSMTEGEMVGDVRVAILPEDPTVLRQGFDPIYRLYRRNPATGLYTPIT